MLLPRFSTRWLLLITTAAACFFFLVTWANRGSVWAMAGVAAVSCLLAMFLIYMMLFCVAWLFTLVFAVLRPAEVKSPFATEALPAQLIAPEDPD